MTFAPAQAKLTVGIQSGWEQVAAACTAPYATLGFVGGVFNRVDDVSTYLKVRALREWDVVDISEVWTEVPHYRISSGLYEHKFIFEEA